MPRPRLPGTKWCQRWTRLARVPATLPTEERSNWSEGCDCIMFNIHGRVWRLLQPLSNENHATGVGVRLPIKTKDTGAFPGLQPRRIRVTGGRREGSAAGPELRALSNLRQTFADGARCPCPLACPHAHSLCSPGLEITSETRLSPWGFTGGETRAPVRSAGDGEGQQRGAVRPVSS